MEWLERFKKVLDVCPEIGDEQLFQIFPELQNDPNRMNAALAFWHKGVVFDEFKPKIPWWKQWLNLIR
jgi:hypothetical protein